MNKLGLLQSPGLDPDVGGKPSHKHFYVTGRIFSPLAVEKRPQDKRDLSRNKKWRPTDSIRAWIEALFPATFILGSLLFQVCFSVFTGFISSAGSRRQLIRVISL